MDSYQVLYEVNDFDLSNNPEVKIAGWFSFIIFVLDR